MSLYPLALACYTSRLSAHAINTQSLTTYFKYMPLITEYLIFPNSFQEDQPQIFFFNFLDQNSERNPCVVVHCVKSEDN